jgi:hypothetical protein
MLFPSNFEGVISLKSYTKLHVSQITTIARISLYLHSLVTRDGGKTFTQVKTWKLDGVRMHPRKTDWLLGYNGTTLYYSTDLGASWTFLKNNVKSYSWCNAGHGVPGLLLKIWSTLNLTFTESRVCLIADIDANDPSGGGDSRLVRTDNWGQSVT